MLNVIEQHSLGERIVVSNSVDFSVLGTANHACLAATFADSANAFAEGRADALFKGLDWALVRVT
jgi:hypothetical protein